MTSGSSPNQSLNFTAFVIRLNFGPLLLGPSPDSVETCAILVSTFPIPLNVGLWFSAPSDIHFSLLDGYDPHQGHLAPDCSTDFAVCSILFVAGIFEPKAIGETAGEG